MDDRRRQSLPRADSYSLSSTSVSNIIWFPPINIGYSKAFDI